MDSKSKSVLFEDYSKTYRSLDHNKLDLIPIFNSSLSNLKELRNRITSYYSIVFGSQRVVDWINVPQLKLFYAAKISPVFVHLKTNDCEVHYKTNSIKIFLKRLPASYIELSKVIL